MYITIETLTRVLYVFNNDPILIYKGTNQLFDTEINNNGKYWMIFGDDGKEATVFDNKEVEKIIAVYFIYYRVEEKIKEAVKGHKAGKEETIKVQKI